MAYTRLLRKTTLKWAAGTKASPTAAAAYRVADVDIVTEQAVAIANNNFIGKYHPGPNRPGGRWIDLNFTSELRGSSTADVPPPEAALMRACGFKETSSGTTPSIVFSYALGDLHDTADSTAGDADAIDITVNQDRLQRVAKNCVGNAVFSFIANQIPTIRFSMRGTPDTATTGATEAAGPTITVGSLPVPVVNEQLSITPAGSTAITSGLICPSLVLDLGNVIDPRDDIDGEFGFSAPRLTGRAPVYTAVIEENDQATIDWEQLYIDQTRIDWSITHNNGGGIREEVTVTFSGTLAQFPAPSDLNGKMVRTLVMQQDIAAAATDLTFAWAAS